MLPFSCMLIEKINSRAKVLCYVFLRVTNLGAYEFMSPSIKDAGSYNYAKESERMSGG